MRWPPWFSGPAEPGACGAQAALEAAGIGLMTWLAGLVLASLNHDPRRIRKPGRSHVTHFMLYRRAVPRIDDIPVRIGGPCIDVIPRGGAGVRMNGDPVHVVQQQRKLPTWGRS